MKEDRHVDVASEHIPTRRTLTGLVRSALYPPSMFALGEYFSKISRQCLKVRCIVVTTQNMRC
jgi:hypothetical protein